MLLRQMVRLPSEWQMPLPAVSAMALRFPRVKASVYPAVSAAWLVLLCLGSVIEPLWSQSVTTVEVYGSVPAVQVYSGLGTNITSTNAWEYAAAQTAHMTWGRFDCGWTGVELTKGSYSFPGGCSTGLTNSSTYAIHPMLDALYGSPYTTIATGTLTSNVSSGATTLSMTVTSGSLSGVVAGQTELVMSPQWSSKVSYSGALITGVAGSTLTMASAATSAFTAGAAMTVNLLFYPPVLVPANQGYNAYISNTSVQAYGAYAHYLATQVAAAGLTGQVSLWNEPPWSADPWDQAAKNGAIEPGSPGLGIELPLYISNLGTAISGVPYDNGYTETAGWVGSLFFPNLVPWQQNLFTLKSIFSTESFHPYGNNPEDALWLGNSCLYANLSNFSNIYTNCTPTGGVSGSSEKVAVAASFLPKVFGGLNHQITETGLCRCNSPTPTETQISRWNLRQFLGFQALGVTPIMFYRMYGDANWEWFQNSTTPYPVYTAFQGLMTDIGTLASSPVAPYSPCMMPRVSAYGPGYFPLSSFTFVGSQAGNKANSLLYFTYQRSYGGNWISTASPSAVNVSVVVPAGLTVSFVKNLTTAGAVSYTFSSQTLTYPVTDDPVEALLVPASASTPAVLSCT
jgi:hypothetical protein